MNNYILNENNQPVRCDDILAWARWYESVGEGRRVGRTDIEGGGCVSTVFLGLDHNYSGKGDPVLWETMVFGVKGLDEEQERYTSHADAVAGHAAMVARARSHATAGVQDIADRWDDALPLPSLSEVD